jgi:hypothetical protein
MDERSHVCTHHVYIRIYIYIYIYICVSCLHVNSDAHCMAWISGIHVCDVNMNSTRCRLHNSGFEAHSIIACKWFEQVSHADVTFSNNAFLYKLYRLALVVVCHSLIGLLMAAAITSVLCITMPSLRSMWLVAPSQTLHTMHGTFVCVDPRNSGLRNIIIENNDVYTDKRIRVQAMEGYALLRQLRNDVTTSMEAAAASCTLFDDCHEADDCIVTPPKKRKLRAAEFEPGVVEIEVAIEGSTYKVVTLQNKLARDKVFVESSPENIHNVVTLLRLGGTAASQLHKARDPTLPRGVWQRNGRYVVHKKLEPGSAMAAKQYKLVTSLEAAQEFLGECHDCDEAADIGSV